jgi:hypothetical protein
MGAGFALIVDDGFKEMRRLTKKSWINADFTLTL